MDQLDSSCININTLRIFNTLSYRNNDLEKRNLSSIHTIWKKVTKLFHYRYKINFLLTLCGIIFSGTISSAQNCSCEEYIYLNEPDDGGSVHKYLVHSNDSLSEIGSPWYKSSDWPTADQLPNPHGLAPDLNGFLYIGETGSGDTRKLTCDGEIFTESEFVIQDGGPNIGSIDNTLYISSGGSAANEATPVDGIFAYDLCSSDLLGYYCLDSLIQTTSLLGRNWGFYADRRTETLYATLDYGIPATTNAIYKIDPSSNPLRPTNDVTNCIPTFLESKSGSNPVIGDNFLPQNSLYGIVTDTANNIYIVEMYRTGDPNDEGGTLSNRDTRILKYSPAGVLIAASPWDTNPNDGGWNNAAGLVYSEVANSIYVSTQSQTDDCISTFNTNLVYQGAAVPSPGNGNNSKGIAILSECCPTSNNLTIDTTLCAMSLNDQIFLQELINCDGIICEGIWDTLATNTGLLYNQCNNSVTITDLNACGTFKLESDGTGNNPQCGAFVITVNIELVKNPTVTLIPDSMICEGEMITLYGILDTPGSPSYQWQSSSTSCTSGFTNISGATDSTYMDTLTETTYYRLLTSSVGNCASGNCADTSSCVTITVNPKPTAIPSPSIVCTNNIDTVFGNPSGGSGTYTTHEWIDQGDGTASSYTLNFTNNQNMIVDASTATPGTINLKYVLVDDVGCFDTLSHMLTVTEPETVSICQDTTNHAELIAASGLTNVIWFNSADIQVGTGDTLFIDAATLGMADGIDSYYYNADDATGCEAGLCCPVIITLENCCKTDICLPFTVTIRRGTRN